MSVLDDALIDQAAWIMIASMLRARGVDETTALLLLNEKGDQLSAQLRHQCQLILTEILPSDPQVEVIIADEKPIDRWLRLHVLPVARDLYNFYESRSGPHTAASHVFEWVAEQYGILDIGQLGLGEDGLNAVYKKIEETLGIKK